MKRISAKRHLTVGLTVLIGLFLTWGVIYSQDKLKAGIEAYKKGDYDQAIYLLNQHLSASPYDYDGNYYLGNSYFQKQNWSEALRVYTKAYQKKVKAELLYQMALTSIQMGDLAQAEKYALEGVNLKGTKEEIGQMNYLLAKVQFEQKKYHEADITLRKALSAEPDNSSYHKLLGDINYERNVASLAISEYNEALKHDPSLAKELHYKLGRAYFLNRQFNEALDQFKQAIESDSNFAEAYLDLGNLYYWGNKANEALWAYERYLKLAPGIKEVLSKIGKMYYSSGQFEKSLEYLGKAKSAGADGEIDSLLTESWFKVGVSNYNQFDKTGDSTASAKAESSFVAVTRQSPTYSEAYSYLGLIQYKRKNYSGAIEHYKRKIELDPASHNAYTNLAYAYHDLGKHDSAVSALQKSVELKPDNAVALGFLAWIYFDNLKNYDRAALYYEKILQLDSADCEARGFAGVSYLIQKKYSPAITQLREAIRCKPRDKQYNLWLAQAYEQTGQKENARIYYKKVLEIDPNNKVAQERLDILEFY